MFLRCGKPGKKRHISTFEGMKILPDGCPERGRTSALRTGLLITRNKKLTVVFLGRFRCMPYQAARQKAGKKLALPKIRPLPARRRKKAAPCSRTGKGCRKACALKKRALPGPCSPQPGTQGEKTAPGHGAEKAPSRIPCGAFPGRDVCRAEKKGEA